MKLPGLCGSGVEGVLQDLFRDEFPFDHKVVEEVGVRHLVGSEVHIGVVHLDIGPVFMGVADKSFELKLDSQPVELFNLLCNL